MGKSVVVSYLRFSRPEQAHGDSVRRQLALSDAWVKERGLAIDTSLSDKGISAFRGANASVGALGTFFSLVQSGRIPRGSILLVESLDRLSRTEIRLALTQFLNLISAGITVVTLSDGKEFSETQCELPDLMYSLMVMSRAHEESATKSRRLTEAWKAKRARIADRPLTRRMPAWCRLEGNQVVVVQEKAEAVRTLYRWVLDGMGLTAIVRRANRELSPLGRVDYYFRSYVHKLLTNRAVLGEFQPHRITYAGGKKRREPVGEAVQGYYPPIVEPDTFNAVQSVFAAGRRSGGPTKTCVNLFRSLLFAADGSRYHAINKGASHGGHVLVSAAAVDGRKGSGRQVGFPLNLFEAAFFSRLGDMASLKMDDCDADALRRKLLAIEGEIESVAQRIRTLTDALMETDAPSTSVVGVIAKLDAKATALGKEREAVQAELRTAELGSPSDAAGQVAQLLVDSMLSTMPPEKRVKLRALVRQIVRRADVQLTRQGIITSCEVRTTLATGKEYAYVASYHGQHRNSVSVRWPGGCETLAVDGDRDAAGSWYSPADIVAMRQGGKKLSEIVAITGLRISAIYRAIRRAGTTPQQIRPKVTSLRWAGRRRKPSVSPHIHDPSTPPALNVRP